MAVLQRNHTHQRTTNLALAGTALCAAPFVVVYNWFVIAMILSRLAPGAAWGAWLLALAAPFGIMARGIFARPAPFLTVSIVGLCLAVVALLMRPKRRVTQAFCVGVIALIIALPLAWRYRPALSAAQGQRAIVVTQPGPLAGVVKAAQVAADERPCTYELLGWQGQTLYYRATCAGESALMAFAPAAEALPAPVEGLPLAWEHVTLSESAALDLVRARSVRPTRYEAMTRPLLLTGDALASADGRWTALVSQHIYGPQDVLVIAAAD
jgi:hypothetical protein